jgi:GGDEF domain-containing protein
MARGRLLCYYRAVRKDSAPVTIAELAAFSILIGGANAFFPQNPGFLLGPFNPYLVLALFAAVLYGKYHGFASLLFSAFMVVLPLPVVTGMAGGSGVDLPAYWSALWNLAPIPTAITMVEVYLLGLIRDSLARSDRRNRDRIADISRDKGLLMRQMRVLSTANLELEERIARQEDSITSLYAQIETLQSLNLSKALQVILEMARRFVGATRCSIWEHRPDSGRLQLVASQGREEGAPASLPDEDTIEGWVVRNNMTFSLKMLLEYDTLARLDKGRNIITLPISAGRRIWGVLNIEEMPFAKYNLYSEKLLLLIMSLAGPALERAIEYDATVTQEEINAVTGLPSFSRFYLFLEKELERVSAAHGTLAVVIFELLNFAALSQSFGKEETLTLLARVARSTQGMSGPQSRLFHYKGEGQLVLLCPNLDSDGVSLFSLNVLGKANTEEWKVKESRAYLELILGFAVRTGAEKSPGELLDAAENLLEMQKV